ncbi:MAG: hypothetical protein ACE5HE_12355 [Phycisphaerae bacterium]
MADDLNILRTFSTVGTWQTDDVDPLTHRIAEAYTHRYSNGTGDNQANAVYLERLTFAAGYGFTYDLEVNFKDATGATIVFTAIKEFALIHHTPANTSGLYVTGGWFSDLAPGLQFQATSTTNAMNVFPGGAMWISDPLDGFAVGADGRQVQVINLDSTNACDFTWLMVGTQ